MYFRILSLVLSSLLLSVPSLYAFPFRRNRKLDVSRARTRRLDSRTKFAPQNRPVSLSRSTQGTWNLLWGHALFCVPWIFFPGARANLDRGTKYSTMSDPSVGNLLLVITVVFFVVNLNFVNVSKSRCGHEKQNWLRVFLQSQRLRVYLAAKGLARTFEWIGAKIRFIRIIATLVFQRESVKRLKRLSRFKCWKL